VSARCRDQSLSDTVQIRTNTDNDLQACRRTRSPEVCLDAADGDPAGALLLAVRAVQEAAARDDLPLDAMRAEVREAALLLRANGGPGPAERSQAARTAPVASHGDSTIGDVPEVRQPGRLESQVTDLVDAARELDAALAAHWQPLKRALADWENAAASIPGVQLTHGILARLEPELARQLARPKSSFQKDGRA
jgi:hypothetical protein